MIISSSAVGMAASSSKKVTYRQNNQTLMTNPATGEKRYSENEFISTYEKSFSDYSDSKEYALNDVPQYSMPKLKSKEERSIQDLMRQLRSFLFEFRSRLTLMIGRRGNIGQNDNVILDLSSENGQKNVWNVVKYNSYSYSEEENMTFETVGKVMTADGKSIDFNMQIEMSRSFCRETENLSVETQVIYTDPLIINLDSNPVSVSDQKWKFDIDGDGKQDTISLLSKGSGFLAFDKNNDGIINDGTELFGAKTGNGFAELLEYDEDGNGWIDEQDSIYSKLKVWLKDDEGNDRLISLKEADVGAIYLANRRTDFSLMREDSQKENARVRRTGMYLTEDGQAKSIQQLDMVNELVS